MRGLTRRWLIRHSAPVDTALFGVKLPALLKRILLARGFDDDHSVLRFCEPRLTHLHHPSLLANIDRAAERLVDAVRSRRRIAIYGDYDVDGITATAILYRIIKAASPDACVTTYVPHRLEEGYGINSDALRQLRGEGVDLVISVDCGITAAEPAVVARDIGLELIITDHHHLPADPAKLPEAILVHPRLPDSTYPFGELCGAGVAFKLAWHFATCWCNSERVSELLQRTLLDLLPLAALGTIADVAPLIDENRIITSWGLRMMRKTQIGGLRALIEASDLANESIDTHKVGFILAPRLNACGRMGHAAAAVRMLTCAPPDEAAQIAQDLSRLNRQRQQLERSILQQACEMAEDRGMTGDGRRAIVLAHPGWHPGVVGIVCSRLVDRFGRPAVLLQQEEHFCKGSARSIDGYSIHEGLLATAEHLVTFGGHAAAAGLTLETAKLEAFTEALTAHANAHITADDLTPTISIDCDAELAELNIDAVKGLGSLSPFGRANRRPTLRVQNIRLAEAPRQIGANGKHLSLQLRQDLQGRRLFIRGVWWNAGAHAADLAAGMPLEIAIEPKLNEWSGRISVEGEIADVRICE